MSIKYRFATNLKDIETRKKHLPSRLKRILVQNESKLLTNAKPRKSSLFHAWRYLSCRRKCFAASIFVHAKNLCKLYVDSDSPKFLLGSFFSASSQAEFALFVFFFPACRKSQMRPSQTRLPTCLFVALPCAQTVAFQCVFKARRVYSQYSANQSQEEEKPYKQSRQRRNQFEKVFFCTCFLLLNVTKKNNKFSVVAVLRRVASNKSPDFSSNPIRASLKFMISFSTIA